MSWTDDQLALVDQLIQAAGTYAALEPGIRNPDPLRRAVSAAFSRSLGRMEVLRLLLAHSHPDEMWPLIRPVIEDSQYLWLAADRPADRWGIIRVWWQRQLAEVRGYTVEEARLQADQRYVGLERFQVSMIAELDRLPKLRLPKVSTSPKARAKLLGDPDEVLDWLWSSQVAHSTVASLHLHTQSLGRPHAAIGLHDADPLHHNIAAAAACKYFSRLAIAAVELLGWPAEPLLTTATSVVAEFGRIDDRLHPMGLWDRAGRRLPTD